MSDASAVPPVPLVPLVPPGLPPLPPPPPPGLPPPPPPPPPARPTRTGWKTGEQLEFLLSHWASFKRSQNNKTLDQFWPRVFDQWHRNWQITPSRASCREYGNPENARLMLQQSKNTV